MTVSYSNYDTSRRSSRPGIFETKVILWHCAFSSSPLATSRAFSSPFLSSSRTFSPRCLRTSRAFSTQHTEISQLDRAFRFTAQIQLHRLPQLTTLPPLHLRRLLTAGCQLQAPAVFTPPTAPSHRHPPTPPTPKPTISTTTSRRRCPATTIQPCPVSMS